MKMTDAESATDLCRRFDALVNAPGGGSQEDWSEWQCDAAAELKYLSARLAADQQKGGGEVGRKTKIAPLNGGHGPMPDGSVAWLDMGIAEAELVFHKRGTSNRSRSRHVMALFEGLAPGYHALYLAPQPSIPAPAQQDGKASGGEVDDAVVRTFIAAYAQAKADRIPKVYAAGQREERDVIVALRAVRSMLLTKERHPPHADQETQG